jgi:hypothetical protein
MDGEDMDDVEDSSDTTTSPSNIISATDQPSPSPTADIPGPIISAGAGTHLVGIKIWRGRI